MSRESSSEFDSVDAEHEVVSERCNNPDQGASEPTRHLPLRRDNADYRLPARTYEPPLRDRTPVGALGDIGYAFPGSGLNPIRVPQFAAEDPVKDSAVTLAISARLH
jgi:hypothetical protein